MTLAQSLSFAWWLDLRQFDSLLHDIADLALDRLQNAGKRRAQGLLHLHHFKREDRRTLFQFCALLREHCDHGARQRRDDFVLAGLLLSLAPERIDPMQFKAAVTRAQVNLMAFDDDNDRRLDAIEHKVEAVVSGRA